MATPSSFAGKVVLFGGQRPGESGSGILAITPDGAGLDTVLEPTQGALVLGGRVAPDGRRLAFSLMPKGKRQPEVWLLGTDGQRQRLTEDGNVVAWSPDGKTILCYREQGEELKNFTLDLETKREENLDLPKTNFVVDWSPDGRSVAVVDGNPGNVFKHPDPKKGVYPLRTVYLFDLQARKASKIPLGVMQDSIGARFSPDGKTIAFTQRRYRDRLPDTLEHSTMVIGMDGSSRREIIRFETLKQEGDYESFRFADGPCWSPDGRTVVTLADKTRWELTGRAGQEQVSKWTFELVFGSPGRGLERRIDLGQKGVVFVYAIDWR